ncbi:MAG TPA: DUF3089 domain-containing protein [Caulobacteraceae bacterium]|jgi:hypothetical protein|nr:DUF3089 domain-containing protein [Caulobacteraceae bacterium]
MIRRRLAALAVAIGVASASAALAQAPAQSSAPPAPLPPNDYGDAATWLCRPDVHPNACDVDLDATLIAADGSTRVQPFHADPHAKIDCFYVYPTVSLDPGVLATMKAEPAETTVVKQQFARLGASCRLFAPLYRQFTLTALAAAMSGHPLPGSAGARPTTPYDDVRDAWNWYLAHENHGRGVVLVGHSQGSGMLTELIKREIDGKPAQAKLVSAILMGTSLVVPADADVGGDFKSIPLCRTASQTGCAIAYSSFRETNPPPENSRFGRPRTPEPGMIAACVNPANLAGGAGPLDSYFPAKRESIAPGAQEAPIWAKGKTIDTAFVTLPGLLTARCERTPQFNYLAIHINADPASPRTSELVGDVQVNGQILRDWGLHLIDANLAMGNLVEIVQRQGEAWTAAHP